ncbi:ribonuclease E/G, partial [uncultured Microbacterium sp.]
LRDIGGIIVVDFIDMVLESNRDLVLRRLIECLSRDRTKHQVAEVTSLGLVQMTRKKLGLGLLETFSEACEVCAGRGVIVHHDPVMKHRVSGAPSGNGGPQNGSSSRRGGNRGGSLQQQSAQGGGTHVITEGVKSALAQIAASTMGALTEQGATAEEVAEKVTAVVEAHATSDAEAARTLDELALALPEAPVDTETQNTRPARKRRGKRTEPRESDAQSETRRDAQDSRERGSEQRAGEQRGNDLRGQRRERAPRTERDSLLDSVLQALPEPKAPGEGRGSRRRVSTGVVTGTPVVMPTGADD